MNPTGSVQRRYKKPDTAPSSLVRTVIHNLSQKQSVLNINVRGIEVYQDKINAFIKQKFEELKIDPATANYVFFWKPRPKTRGVVDEACCCQWWFSKVNVNGVDFPTAEHAMMYGKAELFGDRVAMSAIMEEEQPYAVKAIGRQVKPFNASTWDEKSYDIVLNINREKFNQDQRLKDWLLKQPKNTVFVEASPLDRIWGMGLENNGRVDLTDIRNWRGFNKLGFVITQVHQEMLGNL